MYSISVKHKELLTEILEYCYSSIHPEKLGYDKGLIGGAIGSSFFKIVYDINHSESCDQSLDELGEQLNENISTRYTLCSGLAGEYWLLATLSKFGIADIDESILESVRFDCVRAYTDFVEERKFDYLHGSFGVLHSLLKGENDLENDLVDSINIMKSVSTKGVSCIPTLTNPKKEVSINLHLSHGLASYIIVLCELYEKLPVKDVEHLIFSHLEIILKNEGNEGISIFPMHHEEKTRDMRNAWCYGDTGIGFAIYKVGEVFKLEHLKQKAIEIWLNTASRRSNKLVQIYDFPICHGVFGNLLIYFKIRQLTNDSRFDDVIDFYLDKVERYYDKYSYQMLKYNDVEKWSEHFDILTGNAGIGLVCMTLLGQKTFDWEELLLLN